MGVYTNTAIYPDTSCVNSMTEWFNALDGVSAENDNYEYDVGSSHYEFAGSKITIDGTNIEIFFGFRTSNYWEPRCNIIYIKNGNTIISGPIKGENFDGGVENITLHAYINKVQDSDEIDFIMLNGTIVYSAATNGFEVIYTKTKDGKNLIGFNSSQINTRFADISALRFEDVTDTARIAYSYANMFPFYAMEGTVDFLIQGYFKNGNNLKSFESDIIKECSTVNLLSTVSLPSPLNNHLALGAHCIVPLDDEEVSE